MTFISHIALAIGLGQGSQGSKGKDERLSGRSVVECFSDHGLCDSTPVRHSLDESECGWKTLRIVFFK